MSSLIQHSARTVERKNVYGGYQWNSIVIQDVALKICHISRIHLEQNITRTARNVLLISAELCIQNGGINSEK
jgi:hypothetical protein